MVDELQDFKIWADKLTTALLNCVAQRICVYYSVRLFIYNIPTNVPHFR